MSGAEHAEWAAHYRREPWGEFRSDLRAGIVSSTIINWSGKQLRPNAKGVAPTELMPYYSVNKPTPAQKLRASLYHLVKRA